jgi:DNA-binding NtrC family response regulator
VTSGPDKGRALDLRVGTYTVGKAPSCELALSDSSVSRRHLEIVVLADGVRMTDLQSTNGSFFEGARFDTIHVGPGATVTIGQTELRLVGDPAHQTMPPFGADRFGDLLGGSVAMRQVFSLLERVAASDAAVLVEGETGTGKELVAEALHAASARKDGPFIVCDLGSLPRTLIESELFGHVRGAFTGADRDRVGAFEQADGGTILLDEIGELELDVQPRLLRAIERKQVKPVGSSTFRRCDARVVAATNRDLHAEVKAGRFREDLYHRLAVVCVRVPPLRERREDIPMLASAFVTRAALAQGRRPPLIPPLTMAALRSHDWPGNVRELRNVLERALSIAPDAETLDAGLFGLEDSYAAEAHPPVGAPVDMSLPFKESKDRLVQAWEREYVVKLLEKSGGNVSLAARHAGIDRVYLHRLLKKHGLGG